MVADEKSATNPAIDVYRLFAKGLAKLEKYDTIGVNYLNIPQAQENWKNQILEKDLWILNNLRNKVIV